MNISSNLPMHGMSIAPIQQQVPASETSKKAPKSLSAPPAVSASLPTSRPSFQFDTPSVAFPSASPPVSKEEISWALELESRVTQGYEPTSKEMTKYEGIAQRLAAEQSSTPSPAVPSPPPKPTEKVSQEELNWALQLENKVKTQGYQPTSEEMTKYDDIAQRLEVEQNSGPSPVVPSPPPKPTEKVSQEDLNWAMELENKVKTQGYEPTAEDTARYRDIFERLQGSTPAPAPTPGPAPMPPLPDGLDPEEYTWMKDMSQRIKSGYEPSAVELKLYANIVEQLTQ